MGAEETLYILLLVAKRNKKNVDIQNNKGKVFLINGSLYKCIPQSPFFYARTPKMVLLLSLLSDPTIVDKKGHTVLEACIRLGTSGVSLHKTRHNPACAEALLSTAVSTNNKELVDKNLLLIFNLKMFLKSKEGQWNETEARNVQS